jgi:diacylglycerol kinase family enzyme
MGHQFTTPATFVLVSNTQRYAGEPIMMPGADPSDDLMDIITFSSRNRLDLALFWVLSAFPGASHLGIAGVARLRARSLRIACSTQVEVHLNGDPHGTTPVHLQPSGRVHMVVPE